MSRPDLRPNPVLLGAGTAAAALVSFAFLPVAYAVASTVLAILMIAGAEVDAREYLLPDVVTGGTVLTGLVGAGVFGLPEAVPAVAAAALRSAATAGALALVRWAHGRLTGREGIGLGDVKLAAGVGAWLPLDAIPLCTLLAAAAALFSLLGERVARRPIDRTTTIPFGAFLCPSLWIIFFWTALN